MSWKRLAGKATEWVAGNILGTVGSAALLGLVGWGAATNATQDPWKAKLPKPCNQELICVVVAGLQGDEDGRQTAHIVRSLEEVFDSLNGDSPVQIQTLPRRISRSLTGNSDQSRKEQRVNAQLWLEQQKADVLIYGEVAREDSVLRLGLMSSDSESNEGYALTETLELPKDFSENFGGILASEIASATGRFLDTGRYVDDVLQPLAAKIAPIIDKLPESMSPEARASLISSFANSLMVLGGGDGTPDRLQAAAGYFEAAQKELAKSQNGDPLLQAQINNNLANVYDQLGSRLLKPEYHSRAIDLYKANLEIYVRDRYPVDWAMTQGNLGGTYRSVATADTGRDMLDKSVEALRLAVEAYDKRYYPYDWAWAKRSLGESLLALGNRTDDIKTIEEGVIALRDGVSAVPREERPVQWAGGASMLGDAYVTLGLRNTDADYYRKAVDIYKMALEVYTKDDDPLAWAATQSDLGNAYLLLGEREENDEGLEMSIQAFKEALTVFHPENTPLIWAGTEHQLGNVISELGERKDDAILVREGLTHLQKAETGIDTTTAPLAWGQLQNDIGATYRVLGQLEKSGDAFRKGMAAYDASLTVRTRDEVPFDWAASTANLSYLRMQLGLLTKDVEQLDLALNESEATTEIITREDWPFEWAKLQNNIGEILEAKAELGVSPRLNYQAALDKFQLSMDIATAAQAEYFLEEYRSHFNRVSDKLASLTE